MTTENTHDKGLLEDVQREIRLLAEAHAGHTVHAARTEAKFEQRFKDVEHQLMALDVKVNGKIDALDTKLSTELARIARHLGIGGAPPPAGRL